VRGRLTRAPGPRRPRNNFGTSAVDNFVPTSGKSLPSRRTDANESDLLRQYLADIGRHPLLSRADEQRLGRLIEAGRSAARTLSDADCALTDGERAELAARVAEGKRAARTFVEANLRLVVSIAKRYRCSGLGLLDLVQEGNVGLIHALEKFDFERGYKFSTYATWWVRQAITRAIANTGRTIRLPVHAGETVSRVKRAEGVLESELGRPPLISELAAETDLACERVAEALRLAALPVSIFEPVAADAELTLADVIQDRDTAQPIDQIIAASLPLHIAELLNGLCEREREVVCLRYGFDRGQPRSLAEVGRVCGLSVEGARQVERRALAKLRLRSSSAGMADILAG
jgi:RNA polymerase sigma factor (sigma-70 family)